MTKSKKLIFSLDFSHGNLRLGWNSLRSFRNLFKFFSESVQACVFKNSTSTNLVPIAVPVFADKIYNQIQKDRF